MTGDSRPPLRYERDPAAIYAQSFETVRREARLDRFAPGMAKLATRVIHACGMVEVADRLAFSSEAFEAGARALAGGAPILCDCEMVAAGIIRRTLPADNEVIVTLNAPGVPALAETIAKAQRIRAAALAPAEPSSTDMQVAAEASRMAAQARAEQAAASREKGDDNPYQPRVRAERGALIDQYA